MKLIIQGSGFGITLLRAVCSFILIGGLSFQCTAQQHSVSEDLRFAQYLIDNDQYHDAVYVLKSQLAKNKKAEPAVNDSINYLIGWSYYNLKVLDSSCLFLKAVQGIPFYRKSSFYAVFDLAYQKRTAEAKSSLEAMQPITDSSINKLRNFEFAGIALLERDYQKFEGHSKKFSYDYFPLADEEKKMNGHLLALKKVRKKSPALAGMMSAVVPGSGKFYAGYKGQGIAALMMAGVMGISAAESYYRLGPRSPQFITFGSLFTVFYIGNIWGSTLSVKLAREHQLREIDDEILFDMHIPLRRIFN